MRQPDRAFTLIELLVVVSIIAVLASILMSGVGLVRSAALSAACGSNLRQAFIAAEGYAADQEGALPPSIVDYAAGADLFWFGLLAPYAEASTDGSTAFSAVRSASVLVGCPAYRRNPAQLWDCGYGMNVWPREPDRPSANTRYTNYTNPANPVPFSYGMTVTISLAQLTHAANRPLFGDSQAWELAKGLSSLQDCAPRHRGRLAVVYGDSHVDVVAPAVLRSQRDAP